MINLKKFFANRDHRIAVAEVLNVRPKQKHFTTNQVMRILMQQTIRHDTPRSKQQLLDELHHNFPNRRHITSDRNHLYINTKSHNFCRIMPNGHIKSIPAMLVVLIWKNDFDIREYNKKIAMALNQIQSAKCSVPKKIRDTIDTDCYGDMLAKYCAIRSYEQGVSDGIKLTSQMKNARKW